MSRLCDNCAIPGYCCRSIRLYGGPRWRGAPEGAELFVPEGRDPMAYVRGFGAEPLPFVATRRRETVEPRPLPDWDGPPIGEARSTWAYDCPRLGADGRCTDYENRPRLCRSFAAGEDASCLHDLGAKGDPEELHQAVLTRTASVSAWLAYRDATKDRREANSGVRS